jgi:bifunctional non-homologous end joining protein LigD
LHYDFRLEIGGVLVSWAVPKGPSLDPAERRMARMTEDHPMSYANFEGMIPMGEYGGGPVIVWDRGIYTPDIDGEIDWNDRKKAEKKLREGLKKGKLSIYLKGDKLEGSFTLVRTKDKDDWLLIKHRDEFASPAYDILNDEKSVLSRRTIEDIETGRKGSEFDVSELKGAKKAPFPSTFNPMLASLADAPFEDSAWVFEPKMDGIRAIALITERRVTLLSRRGLDLTKQYPSIVSALAHHTQKSIILDGEIIAFDDKGRPSFQQLQQRMGLTRPADVKIAESKVPAFYYAFDIMYFNGYDLRGVALKDRKEVLDHALIPSDRVKKIEAFKTDGIAAFKACQEVGLEGVMAKRLDSLYESSKRTKSWLKIKTTSSAEFVIGGYTEGLGSRNSTFGSLLLGYYDKEGKLIYAGNVGTGFNERSLAALQKKLDALSTKENPFSKKPPGHTKARWVKPELVAEVKFAEWTKDSILRAPVFLHLREDIVPKNVSRTEVIDVIDHAPPGPQEIQESARPDDETDFNKMDINAVLEQLDNKEKKLELEIEGFKIPVTNLDKVFWPKYGKRPAVTKRDLMRYYAQVAKYLLPHSKDRPLTMVRYPNGIHHGKFYQKHWDAPLPQFVETVRLFSEFYSEDQDYMVCNNLPTLLWLAQIADLEIHTWMARANPEPDGHDASTEYTGSAENINNSLLNYPDYIIFDLDPYIYAGSEAEGEEPALNRKAFKKTCDIALQVREMLEAANLHCFIKTTGKTGLHLYLPIVRNLDYDEVRAAAGTIGAYIMSKHPRDVTMEWAVAKRPGKIFFDHNMNARGKTLASIYSPRTNNEASVSVPIRWEELREVYPTDFTVWNVPERLAKVGDMWADILQHKSDVKSLFQQAQKPTPIRSRKKRRPA